jgi:hypothetical protein
MLVMVSHGNIASLNIIFIILKTDFIFEKLHLNNAGKSARENVGYVLCARLCNSIERYRCPT